MAEGYTKMKNENENLYEENKKLWTQIKNSKIGRFFDTHQKESQRGFDHQQRHVEESQEKAAYWESKNSSTFEKLAKCLNDKRPWKMRVEAKKINIKKCQKKRQPYRMPHKF